MEKLADSGIMIDIELIKTFTGSGGDRGLEVLAVTTDKREVKIYFEHVWAMQYSIENANISRFYHYRKYNLLPPPPYSSLLLVNDSAYLDAVKTETEQTYPSDSLKHYLIMDEVDTILDIITLSEPEIIFLT